MKQYDIRLIRSAVEKAATVTQLTQESANVAGDWINPPYDMRGLKNMVNTSSILPQCIRAYKNNIAGFGIGIRYKDDTNKGESAEMAAEFDRAARIIDLLSLEKDTKQMFEDVIEARETYGTAYLEVIRDGGGEVVGVDFIEDTPSIQKSKPLGEPVPVEYYAYGQQLTRPRRFCRYKQEIGGKTVYFKEFGDPRAMDKAGGQYAAEGLTKDSQANEILEFPIGVQPYGEVRWIGQLLGVDGSNRAESLNNRYFSQGRHTPLMIMLKGGSLTNESYDKLQEYMDGIQGEAGQHAFMLLEMKGSANRTVVDGEKAPDVEIKELASILQKDELFQNYLENSRRRIQSAFQLPDLYVAYTIDFNRATAITAQEVTEKQVFQPERRSLAWALNNKLLAGYGFKYVEAYFKEPDISNPDDLAKIMAFVERAGGLTPNKAKEIGFKVMGEVPVDYKEDWGNIPIAYTKALAAARQQERLAGGIVEKSADDGMYAVAKETLQRLRGLDDEP